MASMAAIQDVSDYASALEFLLEQINYERTTQIPYRTAAFKLDRMRRLLALVGDPHLGLKAVHIAGTKGKGSTAAMVASSLTAAGYRTGLYTSPHLARIEERIAIDGRMCSEEQFTSLAAELQTAVARLEPGESGAEDAGGPTFFEVTTAMAFLHFARAGVDAAVLEVGLGGRLDSTNICQPEVCILTSISYDHMRQLGNTLAAIAGEKAGIIKPGVPVVSGVVLEEPREVIAARAAEVGAPLHQRGVNFDFTRSGRRDADSRAYGSPGLSKGAVEKFDYREPATQPKLAIEGISLDMSGAHQAANAACAIAAMIRLSERGWEIPEQAIRAGLARARCPARIEVLSERPAVVLDVAHNPASVAALLEVLDERFAGRRKVLIFASSKDKDYEAMLALLVPKFETVVLTEYVHNPRAMDAQTLGALATTILDSRTAMQRPWQPAVHVTNRPEMAWELARQAAGPDDVLCIAGSFFLAAELRPVVSATTVEAVP
jgi:dihydrofolate synthase/folylpolyglutamate synthase